MLRWGIADDGQRAVGLAGSSPVGPAEVRLLALAGGHSTCGSVAVEQSRLLLLS